LTVVDPLVWHVCGTPLGLTPVVRSVVSCIDMRSTPPVRNTHLVVVELSGNLRQTVRNGSSVTDCLQSLTCCFVWSPVPGLAAVSRFARTIGVESGYHVPGSQYGSGMHTDVSLVLCRSLVLAALLVVVVVSMVALAPSRSDAVRRH
jgi:hypothetical protein